MDSLIDVSIPVDETAARLLRSPERRAAVGRYVSAMLRDGGLSSLLRDAIADLKAEAHGNGLTDDMVEAELAAWRSGRGD